MEWRNSLCLLAIAVLAGSCGLLSGQSNRTEFRPETESLLAPRMTHSPGAGTFHHRWPITPTETNGFSPIARAAGTIFSGTVTAVARRPASNGQAVETVAITFHVENAIRGATLGQNLTISQWIGLWSGGQRYRVGERVLLFLYTPSKMGLTSCVGGQKGRFSIDQRGRILLSAEHLSAFRADPVLAGKSRARFSDFALAVRQASEGK